MFKYLLTTLTLVVVTIFFGGCFSSNKSSHTGSSERTYKENIAKTGQTTCYNKNYPPQRVNCSSSLALHDDGWYATVKNIGQASNFTANKNHTIITDHLTGLMWQNTHYPLSLNWKQATSYCQSLSLGSYHDWQLPSVGQLETIIDYGKSEPAINPIFSHTHPAYYWTAKTSGGIVWNIDFNYGSDMNYYGTTQKAYVRCVRKEQL